MESNSVALAAIAVLGTAVVGIVWVMKFALKTLSRDIRDHTKAAIGQIEASKTQEKASQEVLTFMKSLNGKLAKATIQTVKEQKVEYQHIEHITK